jgi:SNF2 family DNA or RNA helicase
LRDCNRDFFDANATVQKGLEELGLRELNEVLPGMAVPLLAHQVMGVAWMLGREKSNQKGGILADDMGVCVNFYVLRTRPDTFPSLARRFR